MSAYLEELSVTEAEQLKKTIQALFRQTCILQVKYDPATLTPRDNPYYEVCTRHRNFIEDYLSVLDCELKHDSQEHIYRISGEGVITEKLNLTTTIIILLTKLIYRDKIMGEGLKAPVTTWEELRSYGRNTNLITRKLTAKEWKDALTLMRIHQMIDVPGAVQDIEDDTPIYIYSTIHLFVTAGDIRKLLKEYQENTEYEQHVIQETKHTDEESDGVEKEEQGETTEETVYTDVIK
ncbi:hypothetical protein KGMB01110_00870 [Mediterraneibacter butyricigenes]|uniref:DUF4194 domain-containing protein n=1 Tax=Mediterraneibacter butyricigenes TaxID=2316025 RepID=A0A391NX73_9FIRM|nr:DUF4194 domain-containing protein [Mediterraneibacter butyricigenes]GCA65651.1 hypothetical protein KGMB01110_00870 [Mediterraneibacter butyricigenes]